MSPQRISTMEGLVNSLDTEKFIEAVKKHPAIWDMSHEDHSDRGAKKIAWDTVISTFVEDYEDKSAVERKNFGNAFSRKWKSLRDCYSRELAKKRRESQSGSASYRKEYVYYEQLKFLGTARTNNPNDDDGECSKDNDYDPTDPDYIEEPPPKRARKTKEAKNHVEGRGEKHKVVADPDRLFMLSLVPEMKKIPDHMKLEVKSRLLSVFTSALSQRTPRSKNPCNVQLFSHGNKHQVQVPTVHVTVPISINYDSNPLQHEIIADLNEDLNLNPSLCKSEPVISDGSECEFNESE